MTKDEFIEFCENDFELLEDDEWDSYSLLNGLEIFYNNTLCNRSFLIDCIFMFR